MKHLTVAFLVGSFAIAMSSFAQTDTGTTNNPVAGTRKDPSSSMANDQNIKRTGPSTGNDDALYDPDAKKKTKRKSHPSTNTNTNTNSTTTTSGSTSGQ